MLAVKLYGDVESNPQGIPDSWPAEVRELDEENTLPDDSGLWQTMTKEEFCDYKASVQSEYNVWHAQNVAQKTFVDRTETLMKSCLVFSQAMMIRFSAENIRLGITQAGKTGEVLEKLQPTINALQAGSLLEAVTRIQAIPPEQYDGTYITADRIAAFVAEIHDFLNMS